MVGKVKRARQKLHHAAVRSGIPAEEESSAVPEQKAPCPEELQHEGKDWSFLTSNIFATTKIDFQNLTKKLDIDRQSVVSEKKEEKAQEKIQISKKEKAKQRRERWLQKIECLALAQKRLKAEVKRKTTPVVGDMQPLADALPDLSELTTVRKPRAIKKQPKCNTKKKCETTNYSKMKSAQKRKIVEEEVSRVQEMLKNPSYKANPLATVGQHLLKRMREEREENLH
ncbi:ribosome biogenesis protein SLX9 homolog [Spea bombifrons]|uniref:ribosome biogenesis protein SLX9 homolog n=1 Tax=Spea bombifrons TaxID=233779 RepID=UPI00234B6F76|nr:ribosome biogenesis protein SLX9 homolog [Spea bombifrons]